MDIVTVWGVKWPVASKTEFLLIVIIFLIIIIFLVLLKYNQIIKNKKNHENQLLLFKAKNLDLTNYQYKILNGITNILKLKKPSKIIESPLLFEKAIAAFLNYVSKHKNSKETLNSICYDIVITYEKIYHHKSFQKSIKKPQDINPGQMVYFLVNKRYFIGKVINIIQNNLILQLFRKTKFLPEEFNNQEIKVFFWRSGDAEYKFNTKILEIINNNLKITLPEKIEIGNKARLAFIDVLIPCTIEKIIDNNKNEENNVSNGTIYKINEEEYIIRIDYKLNYQDKQLLTFILNDFNIVVEAQILSDKTISEQSAHYYTMKLTRIFEPARNVIKDYINSHIF